MSEKQTPLFDQEAVTPEKDDLDFAVDMVNSARNLVEAGPTPARIEAQSTHEPHPAQTRLPIEKDQEKPKYSKLKKAGATIAIAGAAIGVGPKIVDYLDGPEISETTVEYVVQPGDTAWSILNLVEGIETTNKQDALYLIKELPGNEDISFGELKPGQVITIPESIEP